MQLPESPGHVARTAVSVGPGPSSAKHGLLGPGQVPTLVGPGGLPLWGVRGGGAMLRPRRPGLLWLQPSPPPRLPQCPRPTASALWLSWHSWEL